MPWKEFVCKQCRKQFLGRSDQLRKFCSRKCKIEFQQENLKGKNNPMYGRHHSLETKKKLSEQKRGRSNWNRGKHIWRDKSHPRGFLGKHHSEEVKRKLSVIFEGESNPFYGNRHSEETRRKLSEANKGNLVGSKNPFYGKHHTEEVKRKISLANKGRVPWSKGLTRETSESVRRISEALKGRTISEYTRKRVSEANRGRVPWHKGKHDIYSPEVLEKIRISTLRRIYPKKDSHPELVLQEALANINIFFEKQKVVDWFVRSDICINKDLQGNQLKYPLLIFCDGCFFHSCPTCFPNRMEFSAKQTRNQIRDAIVNYHFELEVPQKYVVLRFWEHEIEKELDSCVNKIVATIVELRFKSLSLSPLPSLASRTFFDPLHVFPRHP